jgi:hypothetical protein
MAGRAGQVSRLAENVPTTVLSASIAADANDSIECGPGIGPSASTSVLT